MSVTRFARVLFVVVVCGSLLANGATGAAELPPADGELPPCFVTAWGESGTGIGEFDHPRGVAVDGAGEVYVVDTFNRRVQKFDSNGNFILEWGSYGAGDGQFEGPFGVAVDGAGFVYVTDWDNGRIQKFNSNGNFILEWGSYGADDGQFKGAFGVTVDGAGFVYVTDFYNNRVQKFDSNGNFILEWGVGGAGGGQFEGPYGVAVDADGSVYVTDFYNNRVQKFDSNGNFILEWGVGGADDGQFNGPRRVAVDAEGSVYVVDQANHRVQKFDSNGSFILEWGGYGASDGEFDGPRGVAVGGDGSVYVTDEGNNRVQRFRCNQGPIADGDGPYLVAVGTSTTFDGSASSDPDGDELTETWTADGGTVEGSMFMAGMTPGVYNVCLTVNDGFVDSEPGCTMAVVYDPSGGFVTGGGWIDSPAGAYRANEFLTGKASFGFVAKYKKGANVPDGNTEFQFQAGDLNFHSTSYEWLVVAGNKGQFRGEGTVNGDGSYTFMIFADDDSPDAFRIHIWGDGGTVYDNGAHQALGGGSIKIHNG